MNVPRSAAGYIVRGFPCFVSNGFIKHPVGEWSRVVRDVDNKTSPGDITRRHVNHFLSELFINTLKATWRNPHFSPNWLIYDRGTCAEGKVGTKSKEWEGLGEGGVRNDWQMNCLKWENSFRDSLDSLSLSRQWDVQRLAGSCNYI